MAKLARIIGDVPRFVVGDPQRLHQVISYLVTNGIDHTSEGKVVAGVQRVFSSETETLSLSTVKALISSNTTPGFAQVPEMVQGSNGYAAEKYLIVTPQDGNRNPKSCFLRFFVMDTGKGMNEMELRQLSAPCVTDFTTFVNPGIRNGTRGLLLALVQSLVACYGAKFVATSRPGDGTIFEFILELPIGDELSESTVKEPGSKHGAKRLRPSPAKGSLDNQTTGEKENPRPASAAFPAMDPAVPLLSNIDASLDLGGVASPSVSSAINYNQPPSQRGSISLDPFNVSGNPRLSAVLTVSDRPTPPVHTAPSSQAKFIGDQLIPAMGSSTSTSPESFGEAQIRPAAPPSLFELAGLIGPGTGNLSKEASAQSLTNGASPGKVVECGDCSSVV